MATVNKRKVGSFTLSWTPAHDATGRERKVYDILTANCEVRSAAGAPLALAIGGRLHTMSGPPYAVLLSNCTCLAAVSVYTAPVAPESSRSDPVEARRGAIFGPPYGKVLVRQAPRYIGAPPPEIAAELDRRWRAEWRQGR